jgi:ATP-dependent helicase/nuclease subunit A
MSDRQQAFDFGDQLHTRAATTVDDPSELIAATPEATPSTSTSLPSSTSSPSTVPDHAARHRVRSDLATTLFVEAGAGAGKTTALVDRVVNLVEAGDIITGIAAITFTEKAAAELRSRARERLAERSSPRSVQALADLDQAPIGTLHAFARRILNDFPIEAGLPPGFGVLDELESNLRFDDEWSELLDQLLAEADPAGGIVEGGTTLVDLCMFENFGIESGLRKVASDFRYNWDLVEAHVERESPAALVINFDRVLGLVRELAAHSTPPDDKQAEYTANIADAAAQLERTDQLASQLSQLALIEKLATTASKGGNKAKWKHFGGVEALDALRTCHDGLAELVHAHLDAVRSYRKYLAGAICGRFVLDGVRSRVSAGLLDFHDLLVHARQLLASNAAVRRSLHERYPRILLDEFQDTDPIQLEIAVRLSAAPDDPDQLGDWRKLVPLPGRLFIVGDPKQSIYRFRRADIGQYLQAATQVRADTVRLTANFRSTGAVIDFTNAVFEHVIIEQSDTQPAFQHLDACRSADLLGHGSVSLLGAAYHGDLAMNKRAKGAADELRRREASDVVGAVSTALRERWPVVDDVTRQTRPCRPGDICILLPTRLSLPALEVQLKAIAMPYRAENSSVVYAATEVRNLLMTIRAADDPTDELALVAALRSTLYGCSDVELFDWRRRGGSWGIWASRPDELVDHPVGDAIDHIRSINERISLVSAAELLAAVADERRMFDLALVGADRRDVWRRLRFVIDQARAWADAGGRGIRRYLDWARLQATDVRVSETVLSERDHDAVRLMTIHASKGLEFPITIVSGMTTLPSRRRGTEVVWGTDSWHIAGRGDDGSFDDIAPLDERMSDAERRRLLYVACTRAVDHLVVSLHRSSTDDDLTLKDPGTYTSAELLWRYGAAEVDAGATAMSFEPTMFDIESRGASFEPVDDVATWSAQLATALSTGARRSAIAATRLADEVRVLRERDSIDDPGLDKQPVNIDLPPWQRGRYGTSIGRAVHGTLQFCDLSTGDDIEDLARSQCAAESILGLDRTVAALARSAIRAPIVRRVVDGAQHWRELFIAAPVGERVLEGYIDLLVRTPDGLVIVDYKTDQWSGPVQTAERVGRYRMQLAAYGAALEVTLDEPVIAGVLVRCISGEDPEQIDIEDWAQAIADVHRLVGNSDTRA